MKTARFILIALVLAGFAVAAYALPLADWVTALAERARQTGAPGVTLFVAAYVASTVAFLPGSILTLAAGFVYGPVWGIAVASPASVAGAASAFLLGRTLLRGWAEARVGESARAGDRCRRDGWHVEVEHRRPRRADVLNDWSRTGRTAPSWDSLYSMP